MVYLKIDYSEHIAKNDKKNCVFRFIEWIIIKIIPKANPDFEKSIEKVHVWLIEFEKENEIPTREIGLDKNGKIIVKLPNKNNYGFWTDNNLSYEDFKSQFKSKIINNIEFNSKWNDVI